MHNLPPPSSHPHLRRPAGKDGRNEEVGGRAVAPDVGASAAGDHEARSAAGRISRLDTPETLSRRAEALAQEGQQPRQAELNADQIGRLRIAALECAVAVAEPRREHTPSGIALSDELPEEPAKTMHRAGCYLHFLLAGLPVVPGEVIESHSLPGSGELSFAHRTGPQPVETVGRIAETPLDQLDVRPDGSPLGAPDVGEAAPTEAAAEAMPAVGDQQEDSAPTTDAQGSLAATLNSLA